MDESGRMPLWLTAASTLATGCPSCGTDPDECIWDRLEVVPTQVTLDPMESLGGAVPDTEILTATLRDGTMACDLADGERFRWTAENPAVATVLMLGPGSGQVESGVSAGTTQILVELYRQRDNATLVSATVDVLVNPTAVPVTPSPLVIGVGQTGTATASPKNPDGSIATLPVTWTIANANVATVGGGAAATVQVTGVAPGSTLLTARVGTRTGQGTVQVSGVVQPAALHGRFLNWDGSKGIGGVTVQAGPARPVTDANGEYTADVTPGGNVTVFARGICDKTHPLCDFELSHNETEVEMVQVNPGEDKEFNLSAQRGYHVRILGGSVADQSVVPGAPLDIQLQYHAWSRANLPGATLWLAGGFNGTPFGAGQFQVHLIGNAGNHTNQTANSMGNARFVVSAPAADGTYGMYVLLAPRSTGQEAVTYYGSSWPNPNLFIRVFTLRVCAAAPNCP